METYGLHGNAFIECHHNIPIRAGQRITQIEDLALVCSNCHRMFHRKKADSRYYTVGELRDIIQQQRQVENF